MKETIELNHSISMKKNPNSGIEILKVILTFFILVYHCSNQNAYNSEILNIFNHVVPFYFSTYFLIFFYFSYNILSSKNTVRIKQRLLRVLIPYIFWPLIFSVIHILSYKKKNKYKLSNKRYSYSINIRKKDLFCVLVSI